MQNLNLGIAERLEQSGDHVRILVVAANPLGSSPLKLDHEVKTIQEALRRSRKRDNFVVEYRLAATPSELRRALLDVEPHVLHFSGHGAGEQGLLFVSDESASAIYRSEGGEVRSRSTSTNEIKFVPAQPLANLLKLCDEHLECVVLNACYSDVQGNAISTNIPFTIGMRDQVADHVAIKFSQGFYDAIVAGKGYESAFKWGKVAIEFDLANNEASQILVLRKKGEPFSKSSPVVTMSPLDPQTPTSDKERSPITTKPSVSILMMLLLTSIAGLRRRI
ncbi:MAG: CHAT domain-containing protein [Pseudanabaena sp.]